MHPQTTLLLLLAAAVAAQAVAISAVPTVTIVETIYLPEAELRARNADPRMRAEPTNATVKARAAQNTNATAKNRVVERASPTKKARNAEPEAEAEAAHPIE
ncbi:MAG: hypothetical protein M1829_004331 [Trizodia sp. TS-e1964]|nr:MAG: hypothetical protein M1829_004331 [Trizodia sp. TS-e1964]